jgi:DNA replication protein DnaC
MTDPRIERLRKLGLVGMLSRWDHWKDAPWVQDVLDAEEAERQRRSLERRIRAARIGRTKPMADFDWAWPEAIDRDQVEDLFTLKWIEEASNIIVAGPNGTGKTMIVRNLAHQALLRGHTVLCVTASEMLNDLASKDTGTALERRMRKYVRPTVLAVDELGYLSYDDRYADLFFEVVSRRYAAKPILLTTNKAFAEWGQVFPNAASVVTIVDRVTHYSEVVTIKGRSYRRKEAAEAAERKSAERAARRGRRDRKEPT